MKTRAELKAKGKVALKANYWPSVGTLVLVGVVAAVASFIPFASIFVVIPLTVGLCSFFVKTSRKEEATVGTSFKDAFDSNYGRKLGGSLWMCLWVYLWTLLFIIPGIVKSYSYAMTSYILADCPEVKAKEALNISKRMMAGHKAELFVLTLSFILWYILSALTFGILALFYVGPYTNTTLAEYYNNLLEESIEKGIVTREELGK